MARTLTASTAAEATKPKPNTASLGATIQSAFKKLLIIDREIADLEAQHIAPLKEDRTEAWRQLKTDTDLNRKDLALLYAIFKRDKEAADLEDESEREKVRDGLRAGYEALQEGQMLSFLTVVDGANGKGNGADKTSSAKRTIQVKEAEAAGRQAGLAGVHLDKNPHAEGTDEHEAWAKGQAEGQDELAKDLGRGGKVAKH